MDARIRAPNIAKSHSAAGSAWCRKVLRWICAKSREWVAQARSKMATTAADAAAAAAAAGAAGDMNGATNGSSSSMRRPAESGSPEGAPKGKRQRGEATQLSALADMTIVVADTGEIDAINQFKPQDATTNPSLLYKAARLPQYAHLVGEAVRRGLEEEGKNDSEEDVLARIMDRLSVQFGKEITQIVPGYVSTEVDARLSFDTEGTVERARRIIAMYEEEGVSRDRILIKIASTWEGIEAARVLQGEGINCNLTLLFSLAQAIAAAEAGARLISPFVGRILDWHKKARGVDSIPVEEDPGVQSVRTIFKYYKKFGHDTIVMAASFRSKEQVLHIAGVDRATIAPKLLQELRDSSEPVTQYLFASETDAYDGDRIDMNEGVFRCMMNDDAMATEKLAEGIRNFSADIERLEEIVRAEILAARTAGRTSLEQLSDHTIVVADTGEIDAIGKFKPQDATTNPSLLYKAAQLPQYQRIVDAAIKASAAQKDLSERARMDLIIDRLSVQFGKEITQIVPGYVSTEVDARLSFDTEGTVERARRIIAMYEEEGVSRDRILIKIASTWEGIEAARVLQGEGINCNLTLLFSLAQAIAAAEAGARLISPFVGRILDWHKKARGVDSIPVEEDPGVQSVRTIFKYYKKFGHDTIVMAASFRSRQEITALCGVDRATIAPKLLQELRDNTEPVTQHLFPEDTSAYPGDRIDMNEGVFRRMMNDDAMATEKLAEGIRNFSADLERLEAIIAQRL